MDIHTLFPHPDQGRIRKRVFRLVAGYLVALFLSYRLLSDARSSWENESFYWEKAVAIATNVDRAESLREAVLLVGERPPIPEDIAYEPNTRSLAVWDVLWTWVKVLKSEDQLGIATMEQFEWAQTVLETESQMTEGTGD